MHLMMVVQQGSVLPNYTGSKATDAFQFCIREFVLMYKGVWLWLPAL